MKHRDTIVDAAIKEREKYYNALDDILSVPLVRPGQMSCMVCMVLSYTR